MRSKSTNNILMFRIGTNSDGRIRIPRAFRRGLRYSDAGFTLIEALTATTIFAITMTSIVGVYLSVQRLNQTSTAVQALQQNGRFLIEDVTKMVRNGAVDYARYLGNIPQPSYDRFYILDQDDLPVEIRYDSAALSLIIDRGAQGSSPYYGNQVRVTSFLVYVWPSTDPIPTGNDHPTVTIYFNLESNINFRDRINMPFQTTIATRQYD